MIRQALVLTFQEQTPPCDAHAQKQMLYMARRHGAELGNLLGELRIIRSTLNAVVTVAPDDWAHSELSDLVDRIDKLLVRP